MAYYEYLISTPNPEAYLVVDEDGASPYQAAVITGDTFADGSACVMITHTENPLLPGDELVFGRNPFTGEMVEPLNATLYAEVRPTGNTSDGRATEHLEYHSWAGVPARELGDRTSADRMTRLYPVGTSLPFEIEIRHKLFNNPQAPAADGWGFRAEIRGGADSRSPSVRSIGAYDDPEYTTALWPTTGGFVRGLSDWQTDEDGNLIEVWYTDSWDGHRLAEKRDWYVALLWASVEEGRATLPATDNSIVYQFWDHNQMGSEEEILPWVQPQGAHDAYQVGDKVTHNGSTWESTAANNVWAPGVYGWVVI